MARVHAKNTVITVDSNDLSTFTNTSEFERTGDEHDVTTYGRDGHVFDKGLTNGTFTMGGFYDSTESTGPRAVLEALVDSGVVDVVRQPEGEGTGLPQDAFDGLLTAYSESAPVADFIQWSATFRVSGSVDVTAQA